MSPNKKVVVTVMMLVSLCWSGTISVSPLLGWGSYTPELNGMRYGVVRSSKINPHPSPSCAPSWRLPADTSYNLFIFLLGFFLPVIIITTSSTAVFVAVFRVSRLVQLSNIRKKMMKKQWKVLIMVS